MKEPINLSSDAFLNDKTGWYDRILTSGPVHRAKVSVLKVHMVSRYEHCAALLKDPRVMRNRTNATGGSAFPLPTPASVKPLLRNMLMLDDPEHRRLREFVRQG